MKLNCKQGDLAIIVKSLAGNEGKIVRCLEYLGEIDHMRDTDGALWKLRGGARPVWRIDRTINFTNGRRTSQVTACSDANLRPLRGDIEDETINTNEELNTVV